jgi:hypothetical protein
MFQAKSDDFFNIRQGFLFRLPLGETVPCRVGVALDEIETKPTNTALTNTLPA